MKIKLPKDWYIWVSVIAIIAVIILIGPELRIKVLKVLLIVLFLGGMLALAIVPKIIAASQKHWASKPPNARQKQEAKEWDAFIARVKASPAANKPSSQDSCGGTAPADAQSATANEAKDDPLKTFGPLRSIENIRSMKLTDKHYNPNSNRNCICCHAKRSITPEDIADIVVLLQARGFSFTDFRSYFARADSTVHKMSEKPEEFIAQVRSLYKGGHVVNVSFKGNYDGGDIRFTVQADKIVSFDFSYPPNLDIVPLLEDMENILRSSPIPTASPVPSAAAGTPSAGVEPDREPEQRSAFPDADGLIRKMVHTEFEGRQQYDFLLTEWSEHRFIVWSIWHDIVYMAQDVADGDLKPIQSLTCALPLGSGDKECIEQYRAYGERITNIPDILEEEWSSLSMEGLSRELHTPVKLVWFNQTRILRLYSTINDNDRILHYAKTLIGREQERLRSENQRSTKGEKPPKAEADTPAGLFAMYPGGTPGTWNGKTIMRIDLHGENDKTLWANIEHPFFLAYSPTPKHSAEMLYDYLSRCSFLKSVLNDIRGYMDHHIEYWGHNSTGYESRDKMVFEYYESLPPPARDVVNHQVWRMMPLSDHERESLQAPEKMTTGQGHYFPGTCIPVPPCDGYWKDDDMLYLANPFAMTGIFKLYVKDD